MQYEMIGGINSIVRSCIIVVCLIAIGIPVQALLRRYRLGQSLSVHFSAMCGLALMAIVSWYIFRFFVIIKVSYRILILLGAASLIAAAIWFWYNRIIWKFSVETKLSAYSFLATCILYSALSFSNIHPGMLPWLSAGNPDLLNYLKLSNILYHIPNVVPSIGDMDLRHAIQDDVFGCFSLIAFASFILHTGIENCAIPVMAVAVGLIGSAVSVMCHRIFKLTWLPALALPLMLTNSPLMSYITLQYFLGQIIFISAVLSIIPPLAEIADSAPGSIRRFFGTLLVASVVTMLYYHPWFEQFLVLAAIALGIAIGMRSGRSWSRSILTAVGFAAVAFLLINGADALVGTSRYVIAARKIEYASGAITVGWPMAFVDLSLLLSLPVTWGSLESSLPVIGQVIPGAVISILTFLAILCLDKDPGHAGRRLALGCFLAVEFLYLLVWLHFGTAYRQWKFATTLALPLGISVAASLMFLISKNSIRSQRLFLGSIALLCVGASIFGGIQQYRDIWIKQLNPFPEELRATALADNDPSIDTVYVANDDTSIVREMGAAVFINSKIVLFSLPTYYGQPSSVRAPVSDNIAVFSLSCSADAEGVRHLVLRNGTQRLADLASVHIGEVVSFAGQTGPCSGMVGFSAGEDWGRWAVGHSASIQMRCACDLYRDPVRLVIKAGTFLLPGVTHGQRFSFSVNGGPKQNRVIDTAVAKDLSLDVPVDRQHPSRIDIDIDMPDAVSPSQAKPGDPRVLGLSLFSLTLEPQA